MKKILDILGVVERCRCRGGFGSFLLVSWLSWIDTLPNAELSEVGECDLKFSNGLSSGDEVLGLAGDSLLLDFGHDVICMVWLTILPFFFFPSKITVQ